MVNKIQKQGKTFFQCDECKFIYKEKSIAEECEAWCSKHHSCNIEITKHAVKI